MTMKFAPLTPAEYGRMKPFFVNQRYPLCSYSLATIMAWNNCIFDAYYAVEGDALFISEIKTGDPRKKHLFLPVSGAREYPPSGLAAAAAGSGYGEYWFVPETYIEGFGIGEVEKFFRVWEQPGYSDYIYRTPDLAELKGSRYSKKRNLIKQFKREYLDRGRACVEEITPANSRECREFLESWCAEHGKRVGNLADHLECDKRPIANALEKLGGIGMRGILVRVDGRVGGFAMGSRLKEDMGVLNFEKASAAIKGLYQFLDNECAVRIFAGYEYINKESDLNDPGLIKAKKSYFPVMKVKSYRLEMK